MQEMVHKVAFLLDKMTAEEFAADMRTNEAIYALVIKFGEASSLLMRDHQDLLTRFPDFPARSASDMRNRLIHGYWNVNLQILYDTASIDLPAAAATIEQMIQTLPKQKSSSE